MKPTNLTSLRELLKGIDKCETDDADGWWETSTGAEFGAKKLAELEAIVAQEVLRGRVDEREKAIAEAQLAQRLTEKAHDYVTEEGLDGYKCAIIDVLLDHKNRIQVLTRTPPQKGQE